VSNAANLKRISDDVVIFTTPKVLQVCLELDFLFHEIFTGVAVSLDIREAMSARCVIYLEYDFDYALAQAIKQAGKRLVLMHLGDETGAKDLAAYQPADGVLRNYFLPQVFSDHRWASKLHWMPNGYRSGLGYRSVKQPKAASRRTQWARFIGWLANPNAVGNERAEFERATQDASPLLQCIPTAGFAGGYSAHLYQQLMEDAVFAPCPAGNAAETIRLFDAMECGCIPISKRQGFLSAAAALAGAPIEIISHWSITGESLAAFKHREDAMSLVDERQKQVQRFWTATKHKSAWTAAMVAA